MSWQDRYLITSTTGRVYTRAMVAARCRRVCGPGNSVEINRLLGDDSFMRPRRCMVPSAVASDVFGEIAAAGLLVIGGRS